MKVELWVVGKTSFSYLKEGIAIYEKRLKHYLPFQISVVPDIKQAKNLKPGQIRKAEGAAILKKLPRDSFLVLLDEHGKTMDSPEFSGFLEKLQLEAKKKVIFLVGGAFGFSEELYTRADRKISLSKMTFSHQMVRLFFIEQLYRAMTILKGEKYHNE